MGYPYPNFCLCAFLGPYSQASWALLGGPCDFVSRVGKAGYGGL